MLVDSDVFVDHLRGARRLRAPAAGRLHYSVVTRAELFAGAQADEPRVRLLLANCVELAVDRMVAEAAGRLRRTGGIAMPDALIAATALEYGLELCTRNRRHFSQVAGLVLVSPDTRF